MALPTGWMRDLLRQKPDGNHGVKIGEGTPKHRKPESDHIPKHAGPERGHVLEVTGRHKKPEVPGRHEKPRGLEDHSRKTVDPPDGGVLPQPKGPYVHPYTRETKQGPRDQRPATEQPATEQPGQPVDGVDKQGNPVRPDTRVWPPPNTPGGARPEGPTDQRPATEQPATEQPATEQPGQPVDSGVLPGIEQAGVDKQGNPRPPDTRVWPPPKTPEGARREETRSEETRSEETRSEETRSEETRSEGTRSEGTRSEETRSEGTRSEGAKRWKQERLEKYNHRAPIRNLDSIEHLKGVWSLSFAGVSFGKVTGLNGREVGFFRFGGRPKKAGSKFEASWVWEKDTKQPWWAPNEHSLFVGRVGRNGIAREDREDHVVRRAHFLVGLRSGHTAEGDRAEEALRKADVRVEMLSASLAAARKNLEASEKAIAQANTGTSMAAPFLQRAQRAKDPKAIETFEKLIQGFADERMNAEVQGYRSKLQLKVGSKKLKRARKNRDRARLYALCDFNYPYNLHSPTHEGLLGFTSVGHG
jgi:hypothetical protein